MTGIRLNPEDGHWIVEVDLELEYPCSEAEPVNYTKNLCEAFESLAEAYLGKLRDELLVTEIRVEAVELKIAKAAEELAQKKRKKWISDARLKELLIQSK